MDGAQFCGLRVPGVAAFGFKAAGFDFPWQMPGLQLASFSEFPKRDKNSLDKR